MMKRVFHSRIFLVVALMAVGGVATMAAIASTRGEAIAYSQASRSASAAAPDAALAAALARYGGSAVTSARLVNAAARSDARQGQTLEFTVKANGDGAGVVEAAWEADLIQGAVADAAAGSVPVVGSAIHAVLPSGETIEVTGGMGDIVPNQSFGTPSDAAIRREIHAELVGSGLRPISVTVLHAGQPAPAVVAEAADPQAAAAGAATLVATMFGTDPPKYEGYYFEVRNGEGAPLFIQSAAFRTGAGRLWLDPKISDSLTLDHG